MKLVTAFIVNTLHLGLIGFKPFNPIIGETFQSVVYPPKDISKVKNVDLRIGNVKNIDEELYDKTNPTHVYLEQTSHHPPITHFYMTNKNYICYGHRESSAIASGNSVTAGVNGPFNIQFQNGPLYIATFCKFVVTGLIMGKKYFGYEGNLKIEDKTNVLTSILNVNPKPESKGFFSNMFSKKEKNFPDYLRGFICETSNLKYDSKNDIYSCDSQAILANIEGEYSNYLNIDGKCYWDLTELISALPCKQDFILPSDSLLRNDLILFKHGKLEISQYAKMNLEDLQRKDAKLRKKNSEKNK